MSQILIFDGAMGTMLQQRGLAPGQSPEELNLTMPQVVESVHMDYLHAGADIVITNTFGGSRLKLQEYDLQDRVAEINQKAVEIARGACRKAGHGPDILCRRWGTLLLMECMKFIWNRPERLHWLSQTIICWRPSAIWERCGQHCWPAVMLQTSRFR